MGLARKPDAIAALCGFQMVLNAHNRPPLTGLDASLMIELQM